MLAGEPGAASALKVCYAAYTKGTTALLLAIRSLAQAEGVDDALLAEWAISQPELVARSEAGPRGSARKAWRFAGEMDEIADALADAGMPDGFHRGAAETYRRLDRFKDAPEPPALADLIADVLATSTSDPSPTDDAGRRSGRLGRVLDAEGRGRDRAVVGRRGGRAEEVALAELAPERAQRGVLLQRLHALRDRAQPERVGELDDRAADRVALAVAPRGRR